MIALAIATISASSSPVEGNMCGIVMRDAVAPPGSKATSRPSERLGLRNVTYFVAQSPTPSDHCVRFASAVADDYATLASWRRATALPGPVFHRQDRVSFA